MSVPKKLLASLLALALLLSLFACSPSADGPLTADAWIAKGEKYLLDLDYEQAILAFDEAIKIDPKNPRAQIGPVVVWVLNPDRPAAPPVWPSDLPPLPADSPANPLDPANPDPEIILPPILKWLEDHGLLDFLQKLLERLAERWPEIPLFQTELARAKELPPVSGGAATTESKVPDNVFSKKDLDAIGLGDIDYTLSASAIAAKLGYPKSRIVGPNTSEAASTYLLYDVGIAIVYYPQDYEGSAQSVEIQYPEYADQTKLPFGLHFGMGVEEAVGLFYVSPDSTLYPLRLSENSEGNIYRFSHSRATWQVVFYSDNDPHLYVYYDFLEEEKHFFLSLHFDSNILSYVDLRFSIPIA
ncbi:MAG: hypothetical protein LBJ11_01790 [Oscillospiraceae bacterium]|nr:hypothetical protein [Oscillospiraceae bacterium]